MLEPPFSAMIGSQVTCCTWRTRLTVEISQLHALRCDYREIAIAQEKQITV
jgi:hypothetical protein